MVTGFAGALLLIASTAWALPAQAVAPCADNEGCVVVRLVDPVGNRQVVGVFGPGEIGSAQSTDVEAGGYTVQDRPGHSSTVGFPAATSVRGLLMSAFTDRFERITKAVVVRPGFGGSSPEDTLDSVDLQAVTSQNYPFPPDVNGYEPTPTPLFYDEGVSVAFLRPRRSTDDINANGGYSSTASSPPMFVDVTLDAGTTVKPFITADKTQVNVGDPVAFSIDGYEGGQEPSAPVRYYWDFTNGATDTSCSQADPGQGSSPPPYHFPVATDYYVKLTVCGADGSSGTSNPLKITVGKRPQPTKGPTPGGTGPTQNPTDGPGTGTHGPGGKHKGGTPSAVDGPGGTKLSAQRGDTGPAQRQQQANRGKKKNITRGAAGETVSGVLLDADAAKSVTIRAPEAAPVAMAQSRRSTEVPRSWRWLLALLPLTLLLGGVARQTPWLARRLPRIPWRDV